MATFHGEPYELRALGTRGPRRGLVVILASALLLIIGARAIAGTIIDFEWWKEMGQVETWTSILAYGTVPVLAAGVLLFVVLWIAHARGMKSAGTGLGRHPTYTKIATLVLLLLSMLLGRGAIDSWTIVRYIGSRGVAESSSWTDPIFGHPLRFYLFDLPFYRELLALVLVVAATALLVHWLTARVWGLRGDIDRLRHGEVQVRLPELLEDALRSNFARIAAVVFLAGLAVHFYLARYDLLYSEHGFLTGMDWVDAHVRLPIQWFLIAVCLASAAFVFAGRWMWVGAIVVVLFLRAIIPAAVAGLYVRPNELALEKPYIEHHLAATRNGFGLDTNVREVQYPARIDAPIEVSTHRQLFENVRLWDWRAFHDMMSQIQALRQYFVFPDIDVDRYLVEGQQRQVLLAPREIDIRQLAGQQQSSWINTHLIYTHGYGVVMASATHIAADGQPVLYIQDAPPKVNLPGATLMRPELYYGESMHEPVFVRTGQPEFNYPAGTENVHTRYEGKGGIPVSSLFTKLVATVARGDWNIILTGYLNDESRMLIRRNVRERVDALADFLGWDADPYIVLTDSGRLVWMIDGYTMSDAHPYSRRVQVADLGVANYLRNSVKATVDAYDGTVNLYVFDDADPIIKAWRSIFPKLFKNASEMPADLRAHVRYPEQYFQAQAEIFRTFHMRDPENFYNKEDQWDLAKGSYGQSSTPEPVQPTFIIATLPGESKAEFLLVTSFTPRGKDNMIALMVARCDGAHFGELVVLQLSKQALIYGPLQIQARIDSDANISKDLTLWNQQGSQVLRGQLLVLPVEDTFLYVEPIYIQAAQAKIPQLKKVVLATGNRIIYRDTYEQAVSELTGGSIAPAPVPAQVTAAPKAPVLTLPGPGDKRLDAVRDHMRRYREFSAQGKWAEAGKELEAIESILR